MLMLENLLKGTEVLKEFGMLADFNKMQRC